ncbi:hypothetical protein [Streptomyces agglomeratus]|uniref:hypothetical protein n=1 Tax=Streptomyces agglomeratus TaxID=285458 RepID=UPI000A5E335C|nr:hypothetical protein [Streptomyces agglomeratus]
MIVRLLGGPLAGIELETTDAWVGQWLTAGDADWGLYVPATRRPAPSWRRPGSPARAAGSRPPQHPLQHRALLPRTCCDRGS